MDGTILFKEIDRFKVEINKQTDLTEEEKEKALMEFISERIY